ncbi:MAG TPA: cytochrome c-type biogenesis protein CcmH [Polyangiaceae bacterium]|jgi:cytochrome c-type biogenesis protein CcmH/NrfF|nr:cytochrome c-type biogenesis protein CcmH [Polyangiaceae bacterium]
MKLASSLAAWYRHRASKRGSRARRGLRVVLLTIGLALVAPTIGMHDAVGQAHVDRGGTVGIRNDAERQLFWSLICTCGCPRETLGTCTCDYASERRDELRAMIDSGMGMEAIQQAYVKRFGDQALAVPPNSGASRLVWAFPIVAVIAGAYLAVRMLRRWSKRGNEAASTQTAPKTTTRDAYDDRLDDELKELDKE